jgi:hypothetical protein
MTTLILASMLFRAQEVDLGALARKCGSEIPWITDGAELPENEWRGRILRYEHDRDPQLEEALQKARERRRLVLWFCPRVPGAHMYRARILEDYMKIVVFTDPGVVDLIRAKFVPLRMCCDENLSAATGIRRFDFVEPGFVILTPEGKIVHTMDRLRTFNADWFRAALVALLRRFPEYNAPAGESAEDLIRGGDDDKAWPTASPDQRALILRRAARYAEVHALEARPVHRGMAHFNEGDLAAARRAFEKDGSAEALYALAAVDAWEGRSPEPRLREVVARHPDTRWGWRAAANLARGRDGALSGPMARRYETFFRAADPVLPASTRAPAADADAAARRAVEFLLRAQAENGSWDDARFPFSADAKVLPNYWMVTTALAARALAEWRELDPPRVDAAVERAERYVWDESRVSRGQPIECYADAYRLFYAVLGKDARVMNPIVRSLSAQQREDGLWAHSYASSFTTAAIVHLLVLARRAGADVPEAALRRAAAALGRMMGPGGRVAYNADRGPSSEKDSMARRALCALALHGAGRASREDVASGLEYFWKHYRRLEAVRVCDFHADGELGGFTFFYGLFYAAEAAGALDGGARRVHAERLRAELLSIPECDGSFIDSPDLGKSYGTARALLVLKRVRP